MHRPRANGPTFSHPKTGRGIAWVVGIALGLLASACTSSEIPGTYEVEIELVRGARPIEGVLVLSRGILDVPPPTAEDRALLGDWIDEDAIDANSCFILVGSDGATPRNVRLIDVRFRGDGIALPVVVYETPAQRLEVTRLDFFANALGGEVVLQDQGETREGRIHGHRTGAPERQRCIDGLATVRAGLREALAP